MTNLRSTSRKLLLIFHLAFAVGTFGADLTLLSLGAASMLTGTSSVGAAATVADYVVQPLALLTLASGLLLTWAAGFGLLRDRWLTVKLGIVLALAAALFFVLVPALDKMAAGDPFSREIVVTVIAPAGASLLLLVALSLGVLRPKLRPRGGQPTLRPTTIGRGRN